MNEKFLMTFDEWWDCILSELPPDMAKHKDLSLYKTITHEAWKAGQTQITREALVAQAVRQLNSKCSGH